MANILQITKAYPPWIGGIEKSVGDLSEGLSQCGHAVRVLVCNDAPHNFIEPGNPEICRLASLGTFASMPLAPAYPLALRRAARWADIIHLHLPYPMGVLSMLMANPKAKKVVTWHSDIVRQQIFLKFYRPFLINYLKSVELIFPTSPPLIESSPFLNRFRDKCRVVHLGINPDDYKLTPSVESRKRELLEQFGNRIVLFVGRLVGYKGVEYLVRAMDQVDGQLLLVGEGKLRGKLEQIAQAKGLASRLHFLGQVDDAELLALYHSAQVFVLPSISNNEALGIVQLEAMTCGKPVISTNLPTGVPYLNQHEQTGLIVPPKDVEGLVAALNKILSQPAYARSLGEAGQVRVADQFSIAGMVDEIDGHYRGLLAF